LRSCNDVESEECAVLRRGRCKRRRPAQAGLEELELPVASREPGREARSHELQHAPLVALSLAALGIYGVMAYSVTHRSREIGIRMALGANSRLVLGMVLSGGLRLSLLGVALGVVAALLETRVLASLIYGVSRTDPMTLAATAAVVLASAILASWVPALRATRVDPAVSLRAE